MVVAVVSVGNEVVVSDPPSDASVFAYSPSGPVSSTQFLSSLKLFSHKYT